MSAKKNPNAAFSQTLTPEQKQNYNRAIVFDADMSRTFLFSDASKTVAIIKPAYVFNDYRDFAAKVTDQQLEQFHGMVSNSPPTKADMGDRVEWSVYVWMRLCETAINRLDAKSAEGRKVNAKLLDRSYELLTTDVPPELKMPPQSRTCLTFLAELCAADTAYQAIPPADRGVFSVKEDRLKAYVIQEAPRLKTRQDPWRIFQYYRPELIKNKFLRLV